jgi:voltage-gated potassium channel
MLTPLALIDAMAILPFYIPAVLPMDLRYLRAVRLFRVFRIFKAARHSEGVRTLAAVFHSRREELGVTALAGLILLVIASSLVYSFEHLAQPDKFADIPAAMWWGVVTLTTIGYGDIYPITAGGKVAASVISLISVGLVALPTGILASGFVEELHRRRGVPTKCPHCGREIG